MAVFVGSLNDECPIFSGADGWNGAAGDFVMACLQSAERVVGGAVNWRMAAGSLYAAQRDHVQLAVVFRRVGDVWEGSQRPRPNPMARARLPQYRFGWQRWRRNGGKGEMVRDSPETCATGNKASIRCRSPTTVWGIDTVVFRPSIQGMSRVTASIHFLKSSFLGYHHKIPIYGAPADAGATILVFFGLFGPQNSIVTVTQVRKSSIQRAVSRVT
ncbi:hypothetical protein C8R43DRAFT_1201903 [Mycena crocata]|nr:hypothetical protein C8R43DRAFT_1201903 [Mycena crocata]